MEGQLSNVRGFVNSFQSLGTVDGPGVRFVAFLQGCNLRCGCCHNPDTHKLTGGQEYTAGQVADRVLACRDYFGKRGGVTLSGGEPLLQPEFATAIFSLLKAEGINTCLDTSGSIINDGVIELLGVSDRVLLDIKYPTDEDYKKYVGCSINTPLEFLRLLAKLNIPTTLRQVVIPTLNDNSDSVLFLKKLWESHPNVDSVELLPFKKICKAKYDNLGIEFPFERLPTPTSEKMAELNAKLKI